VFFKLLIALWKRPVITRICFEGIKRLQKTIPIEPICIYSEDDSKSLCKEYGFEAYEYKNDPLGEKLNFGLERALESEWDYLLQIGSDDLLSEKLFEMYDPFIAKSSRAFGLSTMYFYDIRTKESYFESISNIFGCGRMIHRGTFDTNRAKFRYGHTYSGTDTVKKKGQVITIPEYWANRLVKRGIGDILELTKEPFKLWGDSKNSGLDFDSQFRLDCIGVTTERIRTNEVLAVDIKSEFNLHDVSEYEKSDVDVKQFFPELNDW